MVKVLKLIKYHLLYLISKMYPVNYAKFLGVNISGDVRIYGLAI